MIKRQQLLPVVNMNAERRGGGGITEKVGDFTTKIGGNPPLSPSPSWIHLCCFSHLNDDSRSFLITAFTAKTLELTSFSNMLTVASGKTKILNKNINKLIL